MFDFATQTREFADVGTKIDNKQGDIEKNWNASQIPIQITLAKWLSSTLYSSLVQFSNYGVSHIIS